MVAGVASLRAIQRPSAIAAYFSQMGVLRGCHRGVKVVRVPITSTNPGFDVLDFRDLFALRGARICCVCLLLLLNDMCGVLKHEARQVSNKCPTRVHKVIQKC